MRRGGLMVALGLGDHLCLITKQYGKITKKVPGDYINYINIPEEDIITYRPLNSQY